VDGSEKPGTGAKAPYLFCVRTPALKRALFHGLRRPAWLRACLPRLRPAGVATRGLATLAGGERDLGRIGVRVSGGGPSGVDGRGSRPFAFGTVEGPASAASNKFFWGRCRVGGRVATPTETVIMPQRLALVKNGQFAQLGADTVRRERGPAGQVRAVGKDDDELFAAEAADDVSSTANCSWSRNDGGLGSRRTV